MNVIKPMLAVSLKNIEKKDKQLILPSFMSTKVDGVRTLVTPHMPQTRAGFALPNHYIRGILAHPDLIGLDGEITVGNLTDNNLCANTVSATNSFDGEPEFEYHIFDRWDMPGATAFERTMASWSAFVKLAPRFPFLRYLEQREVRTINQVDEWGAEMTTGEGFMLKRIDGLYKHGRATPISQELVKVKPYEDCECTIMRVLQGETNTNEKVLNNFGLAKRSSAQAGKSLVETAGALECWTPEWGIFNIAVSNMTHDQRDKLWRERERYDGRGAICTMTYLPKGSEDKPRHGKWKVFRPAWDL